MKYYIIIILVLTGLFATGQNRINGTISGLTNEDVFLMRIIGDSRKMVDTATTDMTGSFEMQLDEDVSTGLYAIVAGPRQMIELIYNNENIRFVSTGNTPDAQVQIIESIENLIYYDYLSLKGITLYKLDLLGPVLQHYPQDNAFYVEALVEAKQLQQELTGRAGHLITENPSTLASHFITVDMPVFAEPELDAGLKKQFVVQHFFDNVDFTDTLLINSNILTSKIVQYLSLYQEDRMTQEQLEDQLLVAVDTVLSKAFVNQAIYEYIINFLINGFEAIGFERGLEHIANQNKLSELCVNTERKAELENKVELIKKLAIGQPAPDFETKDILGKVVSLSEIQADKTLLFFWASWCPHCEDMLPELKELYDPGNPEKLQVVGISIDEEREDLEKTINEHQLTWINIGELKGWNGPIVEKYGIAATPTVYILDKDKTIVGKAGTISELNLLKR